MAETARAGAFDLFLHRSVRASRRSRAAVRRDRVQAAPVLLRSQSLGDRSQAQVAGREPGRDAQAIRRSARHRADARAHSHKRWRCAPRAGQSWRPCVLAAKALAAYIEEHVADDIPLATLAELA